MSSSSISSLYFDVCIPKNARDILAFLAFCRARNYTFPEGYDVSRVGCTYYRDIDNITPAELMSAHDYPQEVLDHILLLAEEDVDHWKSELSCHDPDRLSEVAYMEQQYAECVERLKKVCALQQAVMEILGNFSSQNPSG